MGFTVTTQEGDYDLTADVSLIGNDIMVSIWGGDIPHIGAVAASQPRQSLKDPRAVSSSTSVICFIGHKEDELTKYIAGRLAAAFNVRVVVCAGAHWNNISKEGIEKVRRNSIVLAEQLLERIRLDVSLE